MNDVLHSLLLTAARLPDVTTPPSVERAQGANPVLGNIFRVARRRRQLTLRNVEERTGISNAHLSQIERGQIRRPDPGLIWRLSDLYELDFPLLLDWAIGSQEEGGDRSGAYLQTAVRLLIDLDEDTLEDATRYIQGLLDRSRLEEGA